MASGASGVLITARLVTVSLLRALPCYLRTRVTLRTEVMLRRRFMMRAR